MRCAVHYTPAGAARRSTSPILLLFNVLIGPGFVICVDQTLNLVFSVQVEEVHQAIVRAITESRISLEAGREHMLVEEAVRGTLPRTRVLPSSPFLQARPFTAI